MYPEENTNQKPYIALVYLYNHTWGIIWNDDQEKKVPSYYLTISEKDIPPNIAPEAADS